MLYADFETKYYGSEEMTFRPGQSVKSLLVEIAGIEANYYETGS